MVACAISLKGCLLVIEAIFFRADVAALAGVLGGFAVVVLVDTCSPATVDDLSRRYLDGVDGVGGVLRRGDSRSSGI